MRAQNSKSKVIRDYFKDPDFNERKPTIIPYYLDCNQLYPSAMLYALPVGGWKIIHIADKDGKWILAIDERENKKYVACENMPLRAQGHLGYIIEFS